ncbi:ankyrin-1 [Plakobranchus ocellatus]|uniref:Ankyrin-1 n=1 Tax=Plakobranchus ocellatus TaxID=259542 RepID=A0AAV4CZ32_9GAST|nr:ankyrin-1 [Plakobranchus ocellatus]
MSTNSKNTESSKKGLFTIEESSCNADNQVDEVSGNKNDQDTKLRDEQNKQVDSHRITSGSSSGIGSKGSEISDSSSEGSAPVKPRPAGSSILALCRRGDWLAVEKRLRSLDGKKCKQLSELDKGSGLSPLMLAVQDNRLSVLEAIMDTGADVNQKTPVS